MISVIVMLKTIYKKNASSESKISSFSYKFSIFSRLNFQFLRKMDQDFTSYIFGIFTSFLGQMTGNKTNQEPNNENVPGRIPPTQFHVIRDDLKYHLYTNDFLFFRKNGVVFRCLWTCYTS